MTREIGDRPGDEVVEALNEEFLDEDPTSYFADADEHAIGHLIADEDGTRRHRIADELAFDSHDLSDLSAEESAMHFEEDSGVEDDLSEDVLHDLETFED